MKLFSQFKKTNAAAHSLSNRISLWLNRTQKRWAAYLQQQSEKLSLRGKWLVLVAFTGISVTVCSYVLIQSFYTGPPLSKPVAIAVNPVRIMSAEDKLPVPVISHHQYERIQRFKAYADSLGITDSLNESRPGLWDSIIRFEQLYISQQKNTHDSTKQ